MFKLVDNFLNRITMYRLVLYELIALIFISLIYSFFHLIPYEPLSIIFSALLITLVCWIGNLVSARVFKAATNTESIYITALILVLIISPPRAPGDMAYFSLAIWAGIWSMAGKYIFAIKNKHLFNPAAFGVALTALTINQSASWWVATPILLPFTLIGGWLIVRKIRRADLVLGFFVVAGVSIIGSGLIRGLSPYAFIMKTLAETPIIFFATVMLTEPLTTPPTRYLRLAYGAIVGFLYSPWFHLGSLYSTPELALLVGNVFSYLVSPKQKLILTLKRRVEEANQTMDFVFTSEEPLKFRAGQYLEWTLEHPHADARGNRRYFTIASAPDEKDLHLGVKFQNPHSSFKNALLEMLPGETIVAAQLAGDFVLPNKSDEKLAFIAGGIGVTPFRSMIKDLVDRNDPRSVVLLYINKTPSDIAYAEVFETAKKKIGLKTTYVATEPSSVPSGWTGQVGRVDEQMIRNEIPDFLERKFYLSGPHSMVVAYDKTLRKMGVPKRQIKNDFFPGFA